jgi:hypothetical protein
LQDVVVLSAVVLPAVAAHVSALLTHTISADLLHAVLENLAWIKRLLAGA